MNAHLVCHVIEAVMCAAPFIGIPLLCKRDPAGLYEAERRRRAESINE